jgi:hypothetical protein
MRWTLIRFVIDGNRFKGRFLYWLRLISAKEEQPELLVLAFIVIYNGAPNDGFGPSGLLEKSLISITRMAC